MHLFSLFSIRGRKHDRTRHDETSWIVCVCTRLPAKQPSNHSKRIQWIFRLGSSDLPLCFACANIVVRSTGYLFLFYYPWNYGTVEYNRYEMNA